MLSIRLLKITNTIAISRSINKMMRIIDRFFFSIAVFESVGLYKLMLPIQAITNFEQDKRLTQPGQKTDIENEVVSQCSI